MRGLLRELADRGGAVLLSSHLLREVEVVADEFVVIGRGRVLASGTKAELLTATGAGDLEELFLTLTAGDTRERVRS
jgi:ABC-2 type transport system ATP-binding protein